MRGHTRPGFVLEVDRSTPPILFHAGEGFHLEKLPVGSRVVYPNEPLDPLDDPGQTFVRRQVFVSLSEYSRRIR